MDMSEGPADLTKIQESDQERLEGMSKMEMHEGEDIAHLVGKEISDIESGRESSVVTSEVESEKIGDVEISGTDDTRSEASSVCDTTHKRRRRRNRKKGAKKDNEDMSLLGAGCEAVQVVSEPALTRENIEVHEDQQFEGCVQQNDQAALESILRLEDTEEMSRSLKLTAQESNESENKPTPTSTPREVFERDNVENNNLSLEDAVQAVVASSLASSPQETVDKQAWNTSSPNATPRSKTTTEFPGIDLEGEISVAAPEVDLENTSVRSVDNSCTDNHSDAYSTCSSARSSQECIESPSPLVPPSTPSDVPETVDVGRNDVTQEDDGQWIDITEGSTDSSNILESHQDRPEGMSKLEIHKNEDAAHFVGKEVPDIESDKESSVVNSEVESEKIGDVDISGTDDTRSEASDICDTAHKKRRRRNRKKGGANGMDNEEISSLDSGREPFQVVNEPGENIEVSEDLQFQGCSRQNDQEALESIPRLQGTEGKCLRLKLIAVESIPRLEDTKEQSLSRELTAQESDESENQPTPESTQREVPERDDVENNNLTFDNNLASSFQETGDKQAEFPGIELVGESSVAPIEVESENVSVWSVGISCTDEHSEALSTCSSVKSGQECTESPSPRVPPSTPRDAAETDVENKSLTQEDEGYCTLALAVSSNIVESDQERLERMSKLENHEGEDMAHLVAKQASDIESGKESSVVTSEKIGDVEISGTDEAQSIQECPPVLQSTPRDAPETTDNDLTQEDDFQECRALIQENDVESNDLTQEDDFQECRASIHEADVENNNLTQEEDVKSNDLTQEDDFQECRASIHEDNVESNDLTQKDNGQAMSEGPAQLSIIQESDQERQEEMSKLEIHESEDIAHVVGKEISDIEAGGESRAVTSEVESEKVEDVEISRTDEAKPSQEYVESPSHLIPDAPETPDVESNNLTHEDGVQESRASIPEDDINEIGDSMPELLELKILETATENTPSPNVTPRESRDAVTAKGSSESVNQPTPVSIPQAVSENDYTKNLTSGEIAARDERQEEISEATKEVSNIRPDRESNLAIGEVESDNPVPASIPKLKNSVFVWKNEYQPKPERHHLPFKAQHTTARAAGISQMSEMESESPMPDMECMFGSEDNLVQNNTFGFLCCMRKRSKSSKKDRNDGANRNGERGRSPSITSRIATAARKTFTKK